MDAGWVSGCPRGEFEPHAAIMVSVTELLLCSPATVVAVIGELVDRVEVIAIVRDEEQRQEAIVTLVDWGVQAERVRFVFMPVGTWTRDFAPFFVRWSDGSMRIVQAHNAAPERPNDALVPAALAGLIRVRRINAPLVVVGGNLLSNGAGLCVFTSGIVGLNRLNGRNYGLEEIRRLLGEYYGFAHAVMLEPLVSYRTTHLDMFATFTDRRTVIVGQCDPRIDPASAAILDHNAELLQRIDLRGSKLRVARIPMPPLRDGLCRTYTNVIYANGKVLVPHFSSVDAGLERDAVAVYRDLMPDWEVVQVDCEELIRGKGALRCMTTHLPTLGQAARQTVGDELTVSAR
jgi:agmatine/peptidylarginine deiminase